MRQHPPIVYGVAGAVAHGRRIVAHNPGMMTARTNTYLQWASTIAASTPVLATPPTSTPSPAAAATASAGSC
jgi:hypothetical protein